MDRNTNLRRLQDETFDLCIIGGGASGAGCALDAALRGLKVALIERTDFAAETSSKSTKLIHGGVRYLEQAFKKFDFAQIKQVRHGLEERHILLQNAPHLARPVGLITPVFNWWEGLYYAIGLTLYGWFASGNDHLPKSRWLTKKEALTRVPGLSGSIHSAVLYYDGQFDDARYCLALVRSAAEAGAVVVNHAEVIDFEKDEDGKINAVVFKDTLPNDHSRHSAGKISAKLFLNCTGPFSDKIRSKANAGLEARLRPSKGIHVVLPKTILGSDDALLIPKTKDGRIIFAIPFEQQLLLGTTDTARPDSDTEPFPEAEEIDFLLETLQPYIRPRIDRLQVKSGFGGYRPLIQASDRQTKSLLRDHEVEHDADSNLISLLGGKWTTYRLMAKDAVDFVCRLLCISGSSTTGIHLLTGAEGYQTDFWKKIQSDYGLEPDISQHLAHKYGARAYELLGMSKKRPWLTERLLPRYPFLKAEIVYAVQKEMARTLRDFLARRIRLEITDWQATEDAIPVVAEVMGEELGWTEEIRGQEAAAYRTLLAHIKKQANLP